MRTATIRVDHPKMTREALCAAQGALAQVLRDTGVQNFDQVQAQTQHLQFLIDEIDIIRPLGPDGKHGNRHTEFCGCDDK